MADFDTVRKKRLEELELKKKRLEEMRKSKKEREDEASLPVPTSSGGGSSADKHAEVDDLVKSLLGSVSGPMSPAPAVAAAQRVYDDSGLCVSCRRPEIFAVATAVAEPVRPPPAPVVQATAPLRPESYDKDTQTEHDDLLFLGVAPPDDFVCPSCQKLSPYASASSPLKHRRRAGSATASGISRDAGDEQSGVSLSSEGADAIGGGEAANGSSTTQSSSASSSQQRRRLTEEESTDIMASPAFLQFVSRSSAIVEKVMLSIPTSATAGSEGQALLPRVDPLKDYQAEGRARRGGDGGGNCLVPVATIGGDESLISGRAVNAISFSPHHPELFCVAYGNKGTEAAGSGLHDEGGAAGLVWIYSAGFLSRPEFRLGALSPVLTASFHPQDPHLVVGGCYNGQILLWDLRVCRSGSHEPEMPTRRSSLSGRGHKHPVYSMCFALPGAGASSSSVELLTVSSDGQICHWDLSSSTSSSSSSSSAAAAAAAGVRSSATVLEPLLVSSLQVPADAAAALALDPSGGTSASSLSCPCPSISAMTFGQHPGATDSSREGLVGTGTGQLFRFPVPYAATDPVRCIDAHAGLVTAVQLHPSSSRACRNLLLTASLDWTTKLWNLSTNGAAPLLEFRTSAYDYVCDVCWSPSNAAVFATICTSGTVFLWNLSRSTSEPWDSLTLQAAGGSALNKICWSRDGRLLLVGDCSGRVHCVGIQGSIALEGGDEGRFELAISRGGGGAGAGTPAADTD